MARCGCGSASCTCVVQGDGATIVVTGNGSAANPFVVSSTGADTSIQALDTETIDTTITGTGSGADPYVVSGDLLLSADADNCAAYGSDGALYVPCPADVGTGFRAGAGADSVIGGDLDLAATAAGAQALAIGNGSGGTGDDSLAIGRVATARNIGDIVIGRTASTVSDVSNGRNVVIGDGASADAIRGIAIGQNAAVTADDTAVIKTDDFDIQPSSGGARSNAHVRSVGGTKRRLATIIEEVNTVAATGATETVAEPETASLNHFTLDANCTITFPAAVAGKSFTLVLQQDATGSRTVTWPGTVLWPGGTAPTLTTTANKRDVISFMCADGANWLGFVAGQNF